MTDIEQQKATTERIQDEDGFGVEIRWRHTQYAAEFEVRRLHVTAIAGEPVSEPMDELYLDGFVKWDECADFSMPQGRVHWCSWSEWQEFMALLGHLYVRAFDLMGREPENEPGLSVFRKAVALREAAPAAESSALKHAMRDDAPHLPACGRMGAADTLVHPAHADCLRAAPPTE